MPASKLHLVRHGEVFNPGGVLYERIEGFGLSDLGHQMAAAAAKQLKAEGVEIAKLITSPLQRARESVAPIENLFGISAELDPRVIEPWNHFKGLRPGPKAILKRPSLLLSLHNPTKPSWGEPFTEISHRMNRAALEHWSESEGGDVVIVSHQLPIWMLYRSSQGLKLAHDPRDRRCSLSSITTFEVVDGKLKEVNYREPGLDFASSSVDRGAV